MLRQEIQESETIQFLKTRLMERDRQISDFETKTKKIQLKNNRDLKEAKISEQRAKNLLKEEKLKTDKVSKQLRQAQQQINLLNLRVAELVKQKEREVSDMKNLYNSMKQEVRKYQRILPTLTFLNDFELKIQDIPPYQDIFIGMKEKIIQLEANIQKFEQYKQVSQQAIKSVRQNQQIMKAKKTEIQKNFNDLISKLQEYQFQNSELKMLQSQLRQKNESLQQLYQIENQRYLQLQKSTKHYELKFDEMQSFYNSQLQNKEEQIQKMAHAELSRLQHENQLLQAKFDMKQKMYLQQIRILQEEVQYLQGRISEEKSNFQQHYIQIKLQIERMREEVDHERLAHDDLKERYEELVKTLIKVDRTKQQLQLKVQNQQRKIEMYEQKQRRNLSTVSDIQLSQLRHMQQTYDELVQKYTQANTIITKLKEQNTNLLEEAATLRSQIVSKTTPEGAHTLQLPSSFLQFQNLMKITSNQLESSNIALAEPQNYQILSPECREQEVLLQQIESLRQENNQLRDHSNLFEHQMSKLQDKNRKIEDELLQQINVNQKMSKQLANLRKQRQKTFEDFIKLKEKHVQLSASFSQKQNQAATSNLNCQILKERVQFLTKNEEYLKNQLKDKQPMHQNFKQSMKHLKQGSIEDANLVKRTKELKNQSQCYKKQMERMRSDWTFKENTLLQEIKELKKSLNDHSKLKQKVHQLSLDLSKSKQESSVIQQKYSKIQKENTSMCKQILATKEQIQKKDREIVRLNQALIRERKQRSLLSVPSLKDFNQKDLELQKQRIGELCFLLKQKEQKIHILQRQVSDLKEDIQGIKYSEVSRLEAIQIQQSYYIQQIIEMKMKCAQAEMKAAESQHLYNLLKRKTSKTSL